jgi:hypothetical protein
MNEYRQKLLEEVGIKKCIENINSSNWVTISTLPNLKEAFIREFADNLDWFYICNYIKLSDELLIELNDYILWNIYLENFSVNFNVLKKFILKTKIRSTNEIRTTLLTNIEIQEIQRLLDFRNLFKI